MKAQDPIEQLIESIVAGGPFRLDPTISAFDLDETRVHGRTPLMVAAAQGHYEAVETLVRTGASVTTRGVREMTALHEASAKGDARIVDYLLTVGADADALTVDGVTPLMCAAAWGHLGAAKLLLEKGADPHKLDHVGATAKDIAEEKGEDTVAALINWYVR